MPNPDVLEMLPVSQTVGDFDFKQSFWTATSEGTVVFCYWRYKAC